MLEVKLESVKNLQTKEGYASLTSHLFSFICALASEYLISNEGLCEKDSKLYNSLRAFFTASDYPTETYLQTLFENDDISYLMSFFPSNKKDFNQWETTKDIVWKCYDDKNVFTIGNVTIETKKTFVHLIKKDGQFYASKAYYENESPRSFRAIGNADIFEEISNPYQFVKQNVDLSELGAMSENDFFNSCDELIKASEEQRNAITFDKKKNLVILAGAGSGKTRTLSSRYLYLHFVKQIQLERMLLVTFTRRARSDMQEKTVKLFNKITNDKKREKTGSIKAKTIDSFFRYLTSEFYPDIGFTKKPEFKLDLKSKEQYKKIVTDIIVKNRMEYSFFRNGKIDVSTFFLRNLDTHMRGGKSMDSNFDTLARLVVDYQFEHNELYTFASVNAILVNSLKKNEILRKKIASLYDYVLIDEFQDINDIQNDVFEVMYTNENVHFTFVGDDDQSIYFWRGSNNDIIKNIANREDTDEIFLSINFRNNPYIVKAGNEILSKILTRAKKDKKITPFQTTGSKIRVVDIQGDYSRIAQEIKSLIELGKKPGKIAVLSRMGTSRIGVDEKKPLDHMIDACRSAEIPFEVKTQEAEFGLVYDCVKYLLYGLSNTDAVYEMANQILDDLSVDEFVSSFDLEYLTPALLNDFVFRNGMIDKNALSQKAINEINKLVELKIGIQNCFECDIEEIITKFTQSASKVYMNSNENLVSKLPTFKSLINYAINNPFRWPTTSDKMEDFFSSFEEKLDAETDVDDINTENEEAIKISTIHSFKGLEFDVVFVIGLNEGAFPNTAKLLAERTRKENELKILIENSKTLKSNIEPSINELYSKVINKTSFVSKDPKFMNSVLIMQEYIQEEAVLSGNLTSSALESFNQAYDDYILSNITLLKNDVAQKQSDLDKMDSEMNILITKKANKMSPDELNSFRIKKADELKTKKKPLLDAVVSLRKRLQQMEQDSLEITTLYDLCNVALGCLENISKISELENYIKQLDYELEKKIEEERKLFYVAITRPSDLLYLVFSADSISADTEEERVKKLSRYMSEFILEIPKEYRMFVSLSNLKERRDAHECIKKLEDIYDTSNGKEINDEQQLIVSGKLFSIFSHYLDKTEIKFFNDNPVFNILEGPSRDYFSFALKNFFLMDYLGYDFTKEFLFNMQRCAEEFMVFVTGDNAFIPNPKIQIELESSIDKICDVIKGCITNPPVREDVKKYISLECKNWTKKLKKCGLISYFVRSGKFNVNPSKAKLSFAFPEMKNDPDDFIKAVIDISNYRNAFAHNYKPIWNSDPKEDALNFMKTIILNFYSEQEIKDSVKIIDTEKVAEVTNAVPVTGSYVHSDEYGYGTIIGVRVETPDNKYLVDFGSGGTHLLFDDAFKVVIKQSEEQENGGNTGFEKNPNLIYKSSVGKILEIQSYFNGLVSNGTGFIIDGGYVLTNAHVINDEEQGISKHITGNFYAQSVKLNLNVISYDLNEDMALLKLEQDSHFPGLYITPIPVETGDTVYAIGNTKGEGICILGGMISDANRKIYDKSFFMFSAGTFHGNSGGPILNTRGEVVGIVTLGDVDVQNMNYAIPYFRIINFLKKNKLY